MRLLPGAMAAAAAVETVPAAAAVGAARPSSGQLRFGLHCSGTASAADGGSPSLRCRPGGRSGGPPSRHVSSDCQPGRAQLRSPVSTKTACTLPPLLVTAARAAASSTSSAATPPKLAHACASIRSRPDRLLIDYMHSEWHSGRGWRWPPPGVLPHLHRTGLP